MCPASYCLFKPINRQKYIKKRKKHSPVILLGKLWQIISVLTEDSTPRRKKHIMSR